MSEPSHLLPRSHTMCPYTLRPLSELAKVASAAHVFPHAIGGSLDFSVCADATTDAQLGSTLDAVLADNFLIRMYRTLLGIKSMSGQSELVIRGKIEGTSTRVEITFESDGNVRARVHDPVKLDRESGAVTITLTQEEADKFLKEFVKNQHRRGRRVEVSAPQSLGDRRIIAQCRLDLPAVKRSLLKIAFLGTYWFLGDAWLADPLLPDWHKVLFTSGPSELDHLGLRARAFDNEPELLGMLFPMLQMHEHALTLLQVPEVGIVVSVILFADPCFSVVATASQSSGYGLSDLDGWTAVCDAKSRTTRFGMYQEMCRVRWTDG